MNLDMLKRPKGRPRKMTDEQRLEAGRLAVTHDCRWLAEQYGVSKRTIYACLEAYRASITDSTTDNPATAG